MPDLRIFFTAGERLCRERVNKLEKVAKQLSPICESPKISREQAIIIEQTLTLPPAARRLLFFDDFLLNFLLIYCFERGTIWLDYTVRTWKIEKILC